MLKQYSIFICLMALVTEMSANDFKWPDDVPSISALKKRADAYWKSIDGSVDYLSLTGGTLTGSLYGTSAVFSGAGQFGGQTIVSQGASVTSFISRGDWDAASTNNTQMYITGFTNINKQLRLGYETTNNYGYIQSLISGTATSNLSINPSGGNVGIGTNSPEYRLQISGGDIAFDAEQTERFIRINNSFGGAIRFRGNAITSADRSLQFGRFDGNNNWSPLMTIETNNGNVGVGIENPTEKFTVNGNIKAKKIIVSQTNWPDYVFDSSYSLRTLSEIEKFIAKNKHLPDMPSAKQVEEKGISVGDNQALLLKKIEEMTLYLIEQNKKIEQQQLIIQQQGKDIQQLKKKL